MKELVNSEDKFTEVRTALKGLIKLDFDKLIVSVSCGILKQLADILVNVARVLKSANFEHCEASVATCRTNAQLAKHNAQFTLAAPSPHWQQIAAANMHTRGTTGPY